MVLLAWIFVFYKSGLIFRKRFDSRTLDLVDRQFDCLCFYKRSVTVYAGALVFMTLLPDTFGSPDNAFRIIWLS